MRSQARLPFPDLTPPVTAVKLQSAFAAVIAAIEEKERWYTWPMRRSRVGSYAIRIFALVCLLAGIVLPILPLPPSIEWLRWAHAAVLAGAFSLLADQVLVFTRAHLSYAVTQRALLTVKEQLEIDWAAIQVTLADDAAAATRAADALQLLSQAAAKAAQLVIEETSLWGENVQAGIASLQQALTAREAERKTDVDASAEKRREAERFGALEISIRSLGDASAGVLTIEGKGEPERVNVSIPATISRRDLAPGTWVKLRLDAQDSEEQALLEERVIKIEAGTVKSVEISQPRALSVTEA